MYRPIGRGGRGHVRCCPPQNRVPPTPGMLCESYISATSCRDCTPTLFFKVINLLSKGFGVFAELQNGGTRHPCSPIDSRRHVHFDSVGIQCNSLHWAKQHFECISSHGQIGLAYSGSDPFNCIYVCKVLFMIMSALKVVNEHFLSL